MFVVNDDLSIYATRGDIVCLNVSATDDSTGGEYEFQPGDIVRMKIFGKKDAENVLMQKDFPVIAKTFVVPVFLSEQDTKIGEVISKPKDYWYEIELNPYSNPQTIVGYDEDGPKVFKLFPEGRDLKDEPVEPEDIPIVDTDLDLTSSRPVENKAIARAVTLLRNALDTAQATLSGKISENRAAGRELNEQIAVERARIDHFLTGATPDGAEVVDIRVGADGKSYESAGTAVRSQFAFATAETNALKTNLEMGLVIGSITNGVDEPSPIRARFARLVKACRAVITPKANDTYLYGYATYGESGAYDGVDNGWNAMDGVPFRVDSGFFKMNFRRVDNGAIEEADLEALKGLVTVTQFNVNNDIQAARELAEKGLPTILPYAIELGSVAGGEKVDFTTRARFVDKVPVNEKTVVNIKQDENYFFGYCFYDQSGVFDGVDHGWNSTYYQYEVTFDKPGYVMLNFRRSDEGAITDEDLNVLSGLLTITSYTNALDVEASVKAQLSSMDKANAVNSVGVEYGRYKGASYVFARIPKTTNDGVSIMPKLHLTSADGSIDGNKVSALAFAKRENAVFTMNAGLFNTGTLRPVGQTIIDGVSVVNTPMVDDMGSPISAAECYPLCIDSKGDLSAPYPRSVDTADMIADGVVYAVTGWGKVIDNFAPCADTVENEIVHAETYIRQVIGQFQNGDYFACTVDKSRGHVQNEAGLTYKDLAQLLMDKGVKFAYSLDGGGSAETVIGLRQLNPIYEGTTGRAVPTVIAFEC